LGDEPAWERFLGRWGLVMAALTLALVLTAFGVVGFADSDSARGEQYAELLQAARAPIGYRIFTLFDGLGWAAIGVTLVALGALSRRKAPVMSGLAIAAGVCQALGSTGGFLRMVGTGELGRRFDSADSAAQAALMNQFDTISAVVNTLFTLGDVLQGAGWLLAGAAVLAAGTLPRWLAYLLLAAGVTSSLLGWTTIVGLPFLFPLLLFHVALLMPAIGIGLAVALWWRPPAAAATAAVT
jgi:hypothetical protein